MAYIEYPRPIPPEKRDYRGSKPPFAPVIDFSSANSPAGHWLHRFAMLTPDILDVVEEDVQEEGERLLAAEGWKVFVPPRLAVIAQAASTAVVVTHEWKPISCVKVFENDDRWFSVLEEASSWHIDHNTPTPEILSRIRCLMAAVFFFHENFFSGATLIEVQITQVICMWLEAHRGYPDAQALWRQCWTETQAILARNIEVIVEVAARLDQHERLEGALLASPLRDVSMRY